MSNLSLKQLYATYAPKVLNLLAKDETARAVFGADIHAQIQNYQNAQDKDTAFEQVFMPLFIAKIYPQKNKSPQIAAWLLKAYLTHRHNGAPILAEDFYKVAENLNYFEGLKNNGALRAQGLSGDLLSYKSYQDLLNILKPFDEKRMAKNAADAFRKMTPEQKQIIKQETTILYDGLDGQIVIPHTPRVAQYWGANTKWCLAGKDAELYFPNYNQNSPIVFIIPKGLQNQKIALVKQTLWNAEDKTIKGLPDAHFHLFQNMLASHPADIAADIKTLIKPEEYVIQNIPSENNQTKLIDGIPPEWQEPLANLLHDARSFKDETSISNSLLSNKDFILAAVKEYGYALRYASSALQADRELVLEAVKLNGTALYYASPTLKADREVMLEAVKQNGYVLYYASAAIQADRKIVLEAVKQNGEALYYASPALQADREVVLEAVKQNGKVLYYASPALKADRAFMLEAVKQNGEALVYASPALTRDLSFILACARENLAVLNYSSLDKNQKYAVKVKFLEELYATGQMSQIKTLITRHDQRAWGKVEAQFGDSDAQSITKTVIAQMKAEMTAEARAIYDDLCAKDITPRAQGIRQSKLAQ